MTHLDKLAKLKAISNEKNVEVLSTFLELAGSKICRKAFPFDPSQTEVPEQYSALQLEIANYLLNKRGAEGEVMHGENGITRTYDDGDVPASMMRQVTPFASVLKGQSESP